MSTEVRKILRIVAFFVLGVIAITAVILCFNQDLREGVKNSVLGVGKAIVSVPIADPVAKANEMVRLAETMVKFELRANDGTILAETVHFFDEESPDFTWTEFLEEYVARHEDLEKSVAKIYVRRFRPANSATEPWFTESRLYMQRGKDGIMEHAVYTLPVHMMMAVPQAQAQPQSYFERFWGRVKSKFVEK